jgi:lipopolysaccharide biosynthesis glycosyltransferase
MKYEKYIKDGFLAWTLTSNGYKYLTWNFVNKWRVAAPNHPICVVCADKPSYQFLQREGISCILYDNALSDFGPQIVPFGSKQFSTLNRLKLKLLDIFANDANITSCLYIDGDIIVYKDIVQDIKERLKEFPFWAQCDEKEFDCNSPEGCLNLCSGLIAWSHGADKGVFKITDETIWSSKPEDQVWFNYALKKDAVKCLSLPRDLYPNGARVTKTHTNLDLKHQAICLHYNYRVGDSKKSDMKRFGDWTLPY